MSEPALELAEHVRKACLAAALDAYEDAGLRGLCAEGRWEYAIDALRSLPLKSIVATHDGSITGDPPAVGGLPPAG